MKAESIFKSTGTYGPYKEVFLEKWLANFKEENLEFHRTEQVEVTKYGYKWLYVVSLIDIVYHFIIGICGVIFLIGPDYAKVKECAHALFIACNMTIWFSFVICIKVIVNFILATCVRIKQRTGGCKCVLMR